MPSTLELLSRIRYSTTHYVTYTKNQFYSILCARTTQILCQPKTNPCCHAGRDKPSHRQCFLFHLVSHNHTCFFLATTHYGSWISTYSMKRFVLAPLEAFLCFSMCLLLFWQAQCQRHAFMSYSYRHAFHEPHDCSHRTLIAFCFS